MVELYLYVEGGGDSKALHTRCREGFRLFLERAGLKGHMPRIVASGSRNNAYNDFKTACTQGRPAALLVDSEAPVDVKHKSKPWDHLNKRDGWAIPAGANEAQCHLMVQCMESWFLADRATLQAFFGQEFRANALPSESRPIEEIAKPDVYRALDEATRDCETKGRYGKGEHSFALLGQIDPAKVVAASPWAGRFVSDLKSAMEA